MSHEPLSIIILSVRQDAKVAQGLKHGLQKRGASVRLDHEVLKPGEDWVDSLRAALEKADLILFLVSPEYLSSPSANFGAGMAVSLQSPERRVIPILWGGVTPDSLPSPLKRLQGVAASGWKEEDLLKVLGSIVAEAQASMSA